MFFASELPFPPFFLPAYPFLPLLRFIDFVTNNCIGSRHGIDLLILASQ